MPQAARPRPPAWHPPNPTLAGSTRRAPAPATPAARRPDAPRRTAQDTPRATCGDGSGNFTHCQRKQYPRQEGTNHTNETTSRANGILRPDSSDKLKTIRYSGGTYSKPSPRTKLIPAEEITYVQHGKPYARTVGSAGSQKSRRSVTPPPSSRKVTVVGSTPLTQNPMPSGPSKDSCLPSPKRLGRTENGHPSAEEHISSSFTPRITSLKNLASPDCKSSQPSSSSANLNADASPRNIDSMESTKALAGSYGLNIFHYQDQSSQKLPASLPKEAVVNSMSPSPKQVCAPHPSKDPLGTKAGPSSKSGTPDSGKFCNRNINLTASTAGPVLQASFVEPALLKPTSVFSQKPMEVWAAAPIRKEPSMKPVLLTPIPVHCETSTDVYCNSGSSANPITHLLNKKSNLATLQHKDISPTHSLQSMASAEHPALLNKVCDTATLQHRDISPIQRPQSMASTKPSAFSKERNHISLTHSLQFMPNAQLTSLSKEISAPSTNCDRSSGFCQSIDIQKTGRPIILHTELHKKHYQSDTRWMGKFHVTGELAHTCDGLEAHFPAVMSCKAYEASKQMPQILNLEAVPISQLWPKKFKMKPPDGQDIGLWFISSLQRPDRSFNHLVDKVSSHIGLLTSIGDAELAIFSSKLLAPGYQRMNDELYFWGVFGKHLRKKLRKPNSHIQNVYRTSGPPNEISCDRSEEKGKEGENAISDIGVTLDAREGEEIGNTMHVAKESTLVRDNYEGIAEALDLTGGKETDRDNDCPDSDPAASLLNRVCSHDSANKSSFSLEDSARQPADRSLAISELKLDGFSLVPPGFTKAHRQLQIEDTPVSYADAFTSLALDCPPGFPTIPPGFTEVHRQIPAIPSAGPEAGVSIHGTETKPFVRFSLNVPGSVKMDGLPGFPLHEVKKEPGLPVDETTVKQTPSRLTSAASPLAKGAPADEMKNTSDEVKIEQDEISDEREVPKIRRLSDVYRGALDSTEVCGPVSAQTHPRKRGRQESPERSAADSGGAWGQINGLQPIPN